MLRTLLMVLAMMAVAMMAVQGALGDEPRSMGWLAPLSSAEAWKVMPAAKQGQGAELPTWARMLARETPRTAAAFLELDLAQRTRSPVEPGLRAGMRYVAAKANGCSYATVTAAADAKRAGVTAEKLASLDTQEYAA